MIIFRTIRWKNLLSTGNQFTEVDLFTKDITLIVGANGAGKSTILDALTFALFGKPFRKINKPQLLNTITGKNLLVEVEFSIGSTEYKVVRGIKPDVFEVYQNDDLLNQSAEKKDYQSILEKQILKLKYRTFCQVVILGSATFLPFMQLVQGQRREVIEDLLDLQIFTTMNSLLKDRIIHNNDLLLKLTSEKKVVESKIVLTNQHMLEVQLDVDNQIEEKEQAIKTSKNSRDELEKKIDYNIGIIDGYNASIKNKDKVKKSIEKVLTIKAQIKGRIDTLNNEITFFENHEQCPTCQQEISDSFKNISITTRQESIEQRSNGLEELESHLETLKEQWSEIQSTQHTIHELELENVRMKTSMESYDNFIERMERDIENLKKKQENQTNSKIDEYKKELKDIEKNISKLMDEKEVLGIVSTLLKDQGIKAKIIKQYIPIINKLINKYLAELELFVDFELDENFNETIRSRHRDTFTYASFSEGEKQKIDLALLFTWRAIAKLRNSVSTNLLILDEIMDSSLDTNATEYLMNIFRAVASDSNIFIISHREQIAEKFDNVLVFEKHKNFSSIKE